MKKNQFYYVNKTMVEGTEADPQFQSFDDSFNVLQVTRTHTLPDGSTVVLLNDIHQRYEDVPVFNKQGRMTSKRKELVTYQSEIHLSKEDSARLFLMTSIPEIQLPILVEPIEKDLNTYATSSNQL